MLHKQNLKFGSLVIHNGIVDIKNRKNHVRWRTVIKRSDFSGSWGDRGVATHPLESNFFFSFLFNFNSTVHPTPKPIHNPFLECQPHRHRARSARAGDFTGNSFILYPSLPCSPSLRLISLSLPPLDSFIPHSQSLYLPSLPSQSVPGPPSQFLPPSQALPLLCPWSTMHALERTEL